MLIEHDGKTPVIDPTAWVAPDATLCGNVTVGPGSRVLYGARIIGEAGGAIHIGRHVIVMENAVVRGGKRHACTIGDHSLIGPNAHVTGATIEDRVFVATGAAVFHGAHLERGTEVRIHAIVHLRTRLVAGSTVPIGWVAVGDPAKILPPDAHDAIRAVQEPLNFPEWVYGVQRSAADPMVAITEGLTASLGSHASDTIVTDGAS